LRVIGFYSTKLDDNGPDAAPAGQPPSPCRAALLPLDDLGDGRPRATEYQVPLRCGHSLIGAIEANQESAGRIADAIGDEGSVRAFEVDGGADQVRGGLRRS